MPARRVIVAFALLLVTAGAALACAAAVASLYWRAEHDAPIMMYAARLVAHGAVPYRDFFDMNVPGTYFLLAGAASVFGWEDRGFRLFDLLCLCTLALSTVVWMRRVGRLPAAAAAVGFALWYLNAGPRLSLQREYLGLVPVTLTYALAAMRSSRYLAARVGGVGLLAGTAMLIKPQFVLLALPALGLLTDGPPLVRRLLLFGAGALLPITAAAAYLFATGALSPFLDIASNYWPLYTHMTGDFEPIAGLGRWLYIVKSTVDGLSVFMTPLAVVGVAAAAERGTERPALRAMVGLLAAAAVYPAIAGQFWTYHWIPFQYAAICAASLALEPARAVTPGWRAAVPAILVLFMLTGQAITAADQVRGAWLSGGRRPPPKGGLPDEIATFLGERLRPGDTVQPLDWTAGAVHGMLLARAPLATRFLYDFHFYHHVSTDYIQRLRREFLLELAQRPPRFVVEITTEDKPWPRGRDTTREFPELWARLAGAYAVVLERPAFRIYERVERTPDSAGGPGVGISLAETKRPFRLATR
ncbi:MAG: hypothetical protein IT184_01880 [Acidobacteria bacterium]|nr:hypothetical protein [Acidobacteriota bacterium]